MYLVSKDKLKFLLVVFIVTIIVFNINIYLSPDYEVYKSNWNNLESLDYSEFLWSLLHLISKKIIFGNNYNFFLFFISLLIIYFKFKFLKDLVNSNLILIFYSSSFLVLHESIQIRLAFGILFVLKSIISSKENKGFKSWFFLCLASLVHLSLIFFIIVKLIGNIVKNKVFFLFTILCIVFIFRFISSQENLLLLIEFFSQIGEEWSLKLSKYLYDFLELSSVKSLPLQIYYVGLTYLIYLVFNFNKKFDLINELILISFILIIPVLMIPSDTITSRLIELCFYFLPFIQYYIVKEFFKQRHITLSLTILFILFILNLKMFTNQLL